MQVVYTADGAAQGRKDYAQQVDRLRRHGIAVPGQADDRRPRRLPAGRPYAYLPIVAGGTSFPYQVECGGQMVRNLRLSGETIAKIFTNQITNWNDPAITKDNNGRALPSMPIIPVVRSDGVRHDHAVHDLDGQAVPVASGGRIYGKARPDVVLPAEGRARWRQAGSDQVMNTIAAVRRQRDDRRTSSTPTRSTRTTRSSRCSTRRGYYVEPTQYNVAVALTKAKINQDKSSPLYLTQILDDVYVATRTRAPTRSRRTAT